MRKNSKLAFACAAALGFSLIPVQASANPIPLVSPDSSIMQVQTYSMQGTPGTQLALGAKPKVYERETFTVAAVPLVSYPVSDTTVSSGFGPRTCEEGECSTFHMGADFPGSGGAAVKSIASGTVTYVGFDGNYGNKVVVEHLIHGIPHTSVYAHLADGTFSVTTGQVVERGQLLGGIGDTGRSYGNHLHLEVLVNGSPVDPVVWLSSQEALPSP